MKGLMFLFLLFPIISLALNSDRNQLAHIKADYIQQTPNNHQTFLSGHVTINQGSTHIKADQITIYRDIEDKMKQIVLLGHPAHYQTLPDGNKMPLFARAEKIIYFPKLDNIILIGNAHINQNGSLISGPHIVYNVKSQTLLANAEGQKTVIDFQPSS